MPTTYTPTAVRQTSYSLPVNGDAASALILDPNVLQPLADEGAFNESYARTGYGLRFFDGLDSNSSYRPASDPSSATKQATIYATNLTANRTYSIDDTGCQDGDWIEFINNTNGGGSVGGGVTLTILGPGGAGLGQILPGGSARYVRTAALWTAISLGDRNWTTPLNIMSYIANTPANVSVASPGNFFPTPTVFPPFSLAFTSTSTSDSIMFAVGRLPSSGYIVGVTISIRGITAAPGTPPRLTLVRDNGDGTATQVATGLDPAPAVGYHNMTLLFVEAIQRRNYYVVLNNQDVAGLLITGGYVTCHLN